MGVFFFFFTDPVHTQERDIQSHDEKGSNERSFIYLHSQRQLLCLHHTIEETRGWTGLVERQRVAAGWASWHANYLGAWLPDRYADGQVSCSLAKCI